MTRQRTTLVTLTLVICAYFGSIYFFRNFDGLPVEKTEPKIESIKSSSIEIIKPPLSQSLYVGQMLTLTVEARSPSRLQYQWYKNSHPIPHGTGPGLTIKPMTAEYAGVYSVQVKNEFGEGAAIFSPAAEVIVHDLPPIPQAPKVQRLEDAVKAFSGHPFYLAVNVESDSESTVQWYKDHKPLPGETLQHLWRESTTPEHEGVYHVVVKNKVARVVSNPITLSVDRPILPAHHELEWYKNKLALVEDVPLIETAECSSDLYDDQAFHRVTAKARRISENGGIRFEVQLIANMLDKEKKMIGEKCYSFNPGSPSTPDFVAGMHSACQVKNEGSETYGVIDIIDGGQAIRACADSSQRSFTNCGSCVARFQ